MARREEIIHNGIKYYRYPESRNAGARNYFTAAPMRLHRVVWEQHNGPVPPGHHIHHIDGDTLNNDIANLTLVEGGAHLAGHWNDERRDRQREHMRAVVQPASRAWHSSPEGRAWHAEHARVVFQGRQPQRRVCEQCGNEHDNLGHRTTDRFCSNACRAAHRRASGVDDVDRICVSCGGGFRINRYAKTATCSRACAGNLSSRTKRGLQPDGGGAA